MTISFSAVSFSAKAFAVTISSQVGDVAKGMAVSAPVGMSTS